MRLPVFASCLFVLCGCSAAYARLNDKPGPFSLMYRPHSSQLHHLTSAERTQLVEPLIVPSAPESTRDRARWRAAFQNSTAVQLPGFNYTSYSGFFTTDDSAKNQMFFWFFPAQEPNVTHPPLVPWLQGGPGGSSLFGLFSEMGPISLDSSLHVQNRLSTWNKRYGMLFIDNPVGAGYSHTGTTDGYCTDETCVGLNLYSLLQQFYDLFEEQRASSLYIAGESYAGHYVPAFAYRIHIENQKLDASGPSERANALRVPLAGILLGDAWVDPINMIGAYGPQFYNTGLADVQQVAVVDRYMDKARTAIQGGDYLQAFDAWDEMINGDVYPYPNYFHNITGLNDYDNYARTNAPADMDYFYPFVTSAAVREAIHVGTTPFASGSECELHLLKDFMVSLLPELEVLLENYDALIYSGQFDVIIGAPLTESYLLQSKWSGVPAYKNATRIVWKLQDDPTNVAGYVREVVQDGSRRMVQVIVRDAGHILPHDQPWRALDMVTRFIDGLPFTN